MSRQPAPAHQSTPVGLWLAAAELMFVLFVGDVDADDDDVFTLSCSVRLTLKDQERAKEAGGRERERRSQQPADWTDRQLTGWFISLISSDVFLKVISFMFCRMNWSQVTAEVQQKKNISMWSNVHVTEKLVRKQPANRLQTVCKQAPNRLQTGSVTVRAAEQLSWLHFLCRTNSWQRKRKGLMKDEGLMWWRVRRRRMKDWEVFDVQKQTHWMKSVHHQRY